MRKLKKKKRLLKYQPGGQDVTRVAPPVLQDVYMGYGNQSLPKGFFADPGALSDTDRNATGFFPGTRQHIRNATHSTNPFVSIPASYAQSFGNLANFQEYFMNINSDRDIINNFTGAGMDAFNVLSPVYQVGRKIPLEATLAPKDYAVRQLKEAAKYLRSKPPRRLENTQAVNYLREQNQLRTGNPIGTKTDLNQPLNNFKGNDGLDELKAARERYFLQNRNTGSTDVPSFNKQMDDFRNSLVFGKRNVNWGHNIKDIKKLTKESLKKANRNLAKVANDKLEVTDVQALSPDVLSSEGFPHTKTFLQGLRQNEYDYLMRQYPDKYGYMQAIRDMSPYQTGGIIKDNRGQWAYPGSITQIQSPNITMKGVKQPLLLKPNKGKSRVAYPNEEHYFPGAKYVTEYPLQMEKGGTFVTWEIIED